MAAIKSQEFVKTVACQDGKATTAKAVLFILWIAFLQLFLKDKLSNESGWFVRISHTIVHSYSLQLSRTYITNHYRVW